MSKKSQDKLKPCPFCGPFEKGTPEYDVYKPLLLPWEHGYMIKCGRCPVQMKVQTKFKSQALATWNYRDGKME